MDYFLSLDMAKEIAMVERNEKGKQARRYFIECEKQLIAAALSEYQRVIVQPLIEFKEEALPSVMLP